MSTGVDIGMIVPYEEMGTRAVALGARLGVTLHYMVGEAVNAPHCAQRLIDLHGVEALIVRNPLGHFLGEKLEIPVFSLEITHMDLIRAMQNIDRSKRVGFFHVESDSELYSYGIDELSAISGHDIVMIRLRSGYPYDLAQRTYLDLPEYEAVRHCDALITSTPSVHKFYRSVGKQVEFIDVDPHQLSTMILNAVNAVNARNREIQNTRLTELALNSTNDGFIALRDSRVIMVNDNLCRVAGLTRKDLMQKNCMSLAGRSPFFRKIFSIQRKGIVVQDGVQYSVFRRADCTRENGAELVELISVIDVPNIQKTESSIRKALSDRGFEAKWTFDDIVTDSVAMNEVVQKARQYAASNSNLLILGESGTGKEMFAQSIHNASNFSQGPFVAINCAALPEHLLESELYGYEEGAFTGARKGGKAGLFELSHNGTLFLDEIGELSLALQAKLLRSIQERRIARVGGERMIPITNRLICATHRDLGELVRKKLFREDLCYRIDVLHIRVPPLRERRDGLVHLAECLLEGLGGRVEQPIPTIPPKELDRLNGYPWPGNVRQLETFLERFAVANGGADFRPEVFSELLQEMTGEWVPEPHIGCGVLGADGDTLFITPGTMKEIERQVLRHTYDRCGGNIQRVAQTLNLGRSTVWRKLKSMELGNDTELI